MRSATERAVWERERTLTAALEAVAVLASMVATAAGVECVPVPPRPARRLRFQALPATGPRTWTGSGPSPHHGRDVPDVA